MIKVSFDYAVRHIMRSPLRSFLIIATIAMIMSMYLLISSIVSTFIGQYNTLLHQDGVDIVVQEKFSASPLSSIVPPKAISQICRDTKVKSCAKVTLGKGRLKDKSRIYVFGIDTFAKFATNMAMTVQGSPALDRDQDSIVIGKGVSQKENVTIGDYLTLFNGKKYRIIGIGESWISFLNHSIISSSSTAKKILNRPDRTNMLFVTLHHQQDTGKMLEEIARKEKKLSAVKSSNYSKSLGVFQNLHYLSNIIAFITLLVGSVILINTFLTSVQVRSREIGILNTIGWDKKVIVWTIMIEGYILSLMGGVFGFILSTGLLSVLKIVYYDFSVYLPDTLNMEVFLQGLTMCFVVASIGVMLPAYRATKITIVKVLKNEQ